MAGAARILDHRSIVLVDPMHAIARLQLARALALSGDIVNAKSAYNDLLTVWKNADTDLPVLQEARAEYARLREGRGKGSRCALGPHRDAVESAPQGAKVQPSMLAITEHLRRLYWKCP